MSNRTPANAIAELLVPAAIDVDLKAASKEDVLRCLCRRLWEAGLVRDEAAVLAAVLAREQAGSTGCGSGVAIPHARVTEVSRIVLAAGLMRSGIEFGSIDGQPAKIFFLVIGPQHSPEAYLRLLSQIAQLVREKEFRDALLSCPDAAAVIELLRAV